MYRCSFQKHTLVFKQPAGTSRGIMKTKNLWLIELEDDSGNKGTGEASIIEGLSPEWNEQYENNLSQCCENADEIIQNELIDLINFPSIRFAFESALLEIQNRKKSIYFPSAFTEGKASIPINGLIWMGDKNFMQKQIQEKIEQGFTCIKLKIGAIDFETELDLLKSIRKKFSPNEIELRVDANGAFNESEVYQKLTQLSKLNIHSIEQPVKAGQLDLMKKICSTTPLPVALDEELIGVNLFENKDHLLKYIQPQYIILKPSLVGGFKSCDEWIDIAEKNKTGWWVTSALESNIGLTAIAQYTFTKNNPLPQGLGTGQLFENNFPSNLKIEKGHLLCVH